MYYKHVSKLKYFQSIAKKVSYMKTLCKKNSDSRQYNNIKQS